MGAKISRAIQGVLGTRIEGAVWLLFGVVAATSIRNILHAPRTPFPHQDPAIVVRCAFLGLIAVLCVGIVVLRTMRPGRQLGSFVYLLTFAVCGLYLLGTFLSVLYEEKWRGGMTTGPYKWLIFGLAILVFWMAASRYRQWRREQKGVYAKEELACPSALLDPEKEQPSKDTPNDQTGRTAQTN